VKTDIVAELAVALTPFRVFDALHPLRLILHRPLSVTASPRHLLYLDSTLVLALNLGVRGWTAIQPRTAALAPVTSPIERSWGAWDPCRLSRTTEQSVELQSYRQDRLL
jgi:hypothetical protein